MIKLKLTICLFFINSTVFAYVGPGLGGGVFAAILGVIGAILLLIFGILYYPIKRMIKKRKNKS
jgi:O-antigen/teichoic acid export membrane protein